MKGRRGEKKVDIGEGDLGWGFDSAEINSFFLSKDRLFCVHWGLWIAIERVVGKLCENRWRWNYSNDFSRTIFLHKDDHERLRASINHWIRYLKDLLNLSIFSYHWNKIINQRHGWSFDRKYWNFKNKLQIMDKIMINQKMIH